MTDHNPDSILQIADSSFQGREYETALKQYEQARQAAKAEFNRSVEVEAAAQIARMYLVLGNREKGLAELTEIEERATDSDPMGWSRFLSVKGRYQWKGGDLITAARTFEQMFEYCEVNALWGRAVDAANMVSIVSDDPQVQIEWSRRGIKMAEAGDNENWLGPLWNNLAGVYYDLKQFDSALECYQQAREFHWRYSGEEAKLFADYHIGMTYRLLGKFKEAKKWLRPTLAWAERIEQHSAAGQALEDLGEIAIAEGDKVEGVKMLKQAREEYRIEGFDQSWPEIWQNINARLKSLEK